MLETLERRQLFSVVLIAAEPESAVPAATAMEADSSRAWDPRLADGKANPLASDGAVYEDIVVS